MTTEQEQHEEAGFAAGFSGEEPTVEKPEAVAGDSAEAKQVEEVKQEAAAKPIPALTDEDIASFRAATTELSTLKGQLRDANGRIGALNDLLKQTREHKKDEGKAPVLSAVELKRMKEQYPELAETLTADIGELMATLAKPQDKDEVSRLIKEQVAESSFAERKQMLSDEHPDWEAIKKGEDLWKWIATLPADEASAFQNSANPLYVAKKLTVFKAWRDGATKAKDDSQERLEAAITPRGVPRTSKSTMSDEEAMLKGFEEGFKT